MNKTFKKILIQNNVSNSNVSGNGFLYIGLEDIVTHTLNAFQTGLLIRLLVPIKTMYVYIIKAVGSATPPHDFYMHTYLCSKLFTFWIVEGYKNNVKFLKRMWVIQQSFSHPRELQSATFGQCQIDLQRRCIGLLALGAGKVIKSKFWSTSH